MKIWKNILVNLLRPGLDMTALEMDMAQVGVVVNFKSCIGEVYASNFKHVTGHLE
jgi:hypothetical protein